MTIALAAVGAALATLVARARRPVARAPRRRGSDERLTEARARARGRAWTAMVARADGRARAVAGRGPAQRACSASSPARSTSTRCSRACSRRRGAIDGRRRRARHARAAAGGEPIVATLGLSAEEAERQVGARARRTDARRARSRCRLRVPEPTTSSGDGERDPRRRGGAAAGRDGAARLLTIFTPLAERTLRRGRGPRARGARPARRAGDRERAALPRGAPARRPRRADRACTTAATSTRRSRARSPARTATTAASR